MPATTKEPKFTSSRTEDWRSLAEAQRANKTRPTQSQVKRDHDGVVQPNVFGLKNLAIFGALLAAGYLIDGALSGKRVDGGRGGPFRKTVDALVSPLRRLTGGGTGGRGGWKEKSPAEMARLAAEKRSGGAKSKKVKGKGKKRG